MILRPTYVHVLCANKTKVGQKHPGGLLNHLLILERLLESTLMDFITSLPKFKGFDSIFVVVDRFNKYVTFMLTFADSITDEVARLLLKHVMKF